MCEDLGMVFLALLPGDDGMEYVDGRDGAPVAARLATAWDLQRLQRMRSSHGISDVASAVTVQLFHLRRFHFVSVHDKADE
jgi:hypothetical protein